VLRFAPPGGGASLGARLAARFLLMQGVFGSACGLRWAAAAQAASVLAPRYVGTQKNILFL